MTNDTDTMPSTSPNVALVERLYHAFRADDRAALHQLFTPDVHWVQSPGFPGGGTYVGPDAIVDGLFARLRAEWSGWSAAVTEMLDAGDAVIVLGEYAGTYRATGRTMRSIFAHVYRIRDGRVYRFEQFADTAPLVEATRQMGSLVD